MNKKQIQDIIKFKEDPIDFIINHFNVKLYQWQKSIISELLNLENLNVYMPRQYGYSSIKMFMLGLEGKDGR